MVDITGLMEFAGIWKRREQVFASPAYYVFQMYSSSKGDTVLPVMTHSGSYSVKNGTQGYAEISDVPYIDVVATRSVANHSLTPFCVNRSLTEDVLVRIDLESFAAAATAKVEQIPAVSRYVINDEVEPRRVVPQVSSLNVIPMEPLTTSLPHENVTVIRLQER